MIVDEKTDLKFSNFHTMKKEIAESLYILINKLREMNIITKFIRCNNTGENINLEKMINGTKQKLNI